MKWLDNILKGRSQNSESQENLSKNYIKIYTDYSIENKLTQKETKNLLIDISTGAALNNISKWLHENDLDKFLAIEEEIINEAKKIIQENVDDTQRSQYKERDNSKANKPIVPVVINEQNNNMGRS